MSTNTDPCRGYAAPGLPCVLTHGHAPPCVSAVQPQSMSEWGCCRCGSLARVSMSAFCGPCLYAAHLAAAPAGETSDQRLSDLATLREAPALATELRRLADRVERMGEAAARVMARGGGG